MFAPNPRALDDLHRLPDGETLGAGVTEVRPLRFGQAPAPQLFRREAADVVGHVHAATAGSVKRLRLLASWAGVLGERAPNGW